MYTDCDVDADASTGVLCWRKLNMMKPSFTPQLASLRILLLLVSSHTDIDPKTMESARAGIPVTTQRRFDVYQDVSAAA
jgi:hypothetical protein